MKFFHLILAFNFAQALPSASRIFGGEIVEDKPGERGKFHYLALITGVEDTICSGVFIQANWVLTAAHCLFDLESTRIFAGPTTNFTSADEYRVVEISRHPEFEPVNLKNDIALLKVESLESSPSNFPLLPSYPSIELEYEENSCHAAGYGLSSDNSFTADGHLYSVKMPIVDSEICKKHNTKLEDFYATVEYEKLICAGEVGVADSCPGDSGGPLICLSKAGDKIIAGLTSFGPSPCGSGYGVYTKVSNHSRWIDSAIKKKETIKRTCCTEVILESNIDELNGVYQQTENNEFYNRTTGNAFVQRAEFSGSVYWFFFNTDKRSTSTARIRTNDSFKNSDETCLLQQGDAVENSAVFDYQIGEITDKWITDDGTISLICSEEDQMSTTVQTTSKTTEIPITSNPTKRNQISTISTEKTTEVAQTDQSMESTSTATGPLTTTPSTESPSESTITRTVSSIDLTTESSACFYHSVLFLILLALSL